MKSFLAIVLMLLTCTAAFAQEGPPPREGGPGERPRQGGPPGGPRGEMNRPPLGLGGPGGPDGDGPRGQDPRMAKFEMIRHFLDSVDRYTRMSSDPTTAGVAAVVSAADMLRAKGTQPAIDYFTKMMPQVKNETVVRAIRLQLIELHKQAGENDKAMEHLSALITGATASEK